MSEAELERRLYRARGIHAGQPGAGARLGRRCSGSSRHKHVTLRLLWEEYKAEHPDGYQYSWFCERYRAWRKRIDVVMRQEHKPGEKLFVDWAGDTLPHRSRTGEIRPGYLFVAVLGASNYTYAEPSLSQDLGGLPCRPRAHVRRSSAACPELLVPDNLKTGVTKASRYEPDLNPAYTALAAHYGCAVLPARPHKPRDKAKVETGVLIAERRIIARLRKRTFFTLAELKAAVAEQVRELNERPFQKLPGSRKSLFLPKSCRRFGPCPPPYEHRTARAPACTSTTTWSSWATATRCPTSSAARRSRSATPRPWSRSSTRACAWPLTCQSTHPLHSRPRLPL